MDAAARLRPFLFVAFAGRAHPRMAWIYRSQARGISIHAMRGWITALPGCSTAAYGAALPRAAENATMQGFPRRAPTLTAAEKSDTVARGPALAPAFP